MSPASRPRRLLALLLLLLLPLPSRRHARDPVAQWLADSFTV